MAVAEAAEDINMKSITAFIIALLIIIIISTGCSKEVDTKYDSFAKCLTEKGAVMYGTYWCTHCQAQKRDFGDSFKYVNYVECTEDKDRCIEEDIKGFPTWIVDEQLYPGRQKMEKLAELTGCKLPQL